MCTRARRLYPRHLFGKKRLGGVRSCTSFGASVSLSERANISARPRRISSLAPVFPAPACAACMAPRYHGRGGDQWPRTHNGIRLIVAMKVDSTPSLPCRLFGHLSSNVAMPLFCHTLLTLSHYFLGAHVTVMAEAFTTVAHFSHGNLDQSFTAHEPERRGGFFSMRGSRGVSVRRLWCEPHGSAFQTHKARWRSVCRTFDFLIKISSKDY